MGRRINGECFSGLGSGIILNSQGWVLTAAHVADQINEYAESHRVIAGRAGKVAAIRANKSLPRKEQQKQLRALGQAKPMDVCNYGMLWGATGGKILEMQKLSHVDIAIGQLQEVDMSKFKVFPKFRKSGDSDGLGATVCRIGFPFHSIETGWDDSQKLFAFPNGVFPLATFANEGIVSRYQTLVVADEDPPLGYERKFFETSTPGLKGQSGGPIFDAEGRIWGIQSRTTSYMLGFSPKVNGKEEHQFLNVGQAVDASTVCAFLDEHGVSYETA